MESRGRKVLKRVFPAIILRYISAEMAKAFSLTLAVVTLVWVFVFTLQLVRHNIVAPKQFVIVVPLFAVVSLAYTLPIAVLFGVSIAYGRLSADNEIRAMAWNGVHLAWTVLPAAAIAVLATALSLYVNTSAVPSALRMTNRLVTSDIIDAAGREFAAACRAGEAVKFSNISMRMEGFDLASNTATGVSILIAEKEEGWKVTYNLTADAARVVKGKAPGAVEFSPSPDRPDSQKRFISFIFVNGVIQEYDPDARMALSAKAPAPPVAIDVSHDVNRRRLKDLNWRELADLSRTDERPSVKNKARTLLFERIALGVSPFFFALVAAPMAMVARWKHMLTSFLPSLVIAAAVYYPLVMWAKVQGEAGSLDPALWMFAGNALMLVLSAVLMVIVLRR